MSKKKFKRVLVVLGGTSGEREVSLDSGKACIKALKKKKYIVSVFDPKNKNFNLINKKKTDVIFNALHGKDGEDGVAGGCTVRVQPSSNVIIFVGLAPR